VGKILDDMSQKLIKQIVLKDSDGYYFTGSYRNDFWTKDIHEASSFSDPESAFSLMTQYLVNLHKEEGSFSSGIKDATWPLECVTIFNLEDE
jgi:hypothetical protein